MTTIYAAIAKYGTVLFGLLIGALGYFGAKIAEGEEIEAKHVIGYMMQLGLIGLIAALIVETAKLESALWQSAITAMLALGTNEVIKWVKMVGWKRAVQIIAPGHHVEETQKKDHEQ